MAAGQLALGWHPDASNNWRKAQVPIRRMVIFRFGQAIIFALALCCICPGSGGGAGIGAGSRYNGAITMNLDPKHGSAS